jgi:ribosomal protein S18 acetylase RimI-like enzyme
MNLPSDQARIRIANTTDVSAIARIVEYAYRHYIPRMGKPPGPMLDDYSARALEGVVWVMEDAKTIVGILVLVPKPDHLLLDNIAVSPSHQGRGFGRRLLEFAEAEALRLGYREIRLYTHETMTENQRLYAAIGYKETGRGNEAEYERVFMRKRLAG